MADTIQYITFDEMIPANGAGGTSTLTGTLKVDYTTMTVSNTLTAQAPNASETFSPMSVQMRPQDNGQYLITVGGNSGTNGNSLTIFYTGQNPSQVRVAYLLDGTTYGNTNPDGGQTEAVSSSPTPPVCFVQGTLIRTTKGDVCVEHLNIGDECITSSGVARPVRWLGQQTISFTGDNREDMPILVRAGAIRTGLPYADLCLSPGHSVCVDVLGEILMPVVNLVNGTTIVRQTVSSATYWHVELDGHDVIMANGLPSESYVDCGNRGFFIGETSKPDGFATTADYCRPFVTDELLSRALRARLQARAVEAGWSVERRPLDARLMVGGRAFTPAFGHREGMMVASFSVPASVEGEWALNSTIFVPAHFDGGNDRRELGLQVFDIEVDGERLGLDRLGAAKGFDAEEAEGAIRWRWTGASARLPRTDRDRASSGFITVDVLLLNHNTPVWIAPGAGIDPRPKLSLVA